MAFRASSIHLRERILSFGAAGLGKSRDFYSIGARILRTKSDAHIHIIDNDESAYRMMVDPEWADLYFKDDGELVDQVHVHPVYDWVSLMSAVEAVLQVAKPQDWTNIDMITPSYDWAQGYYTDKTYGKSLDEYFIEKRKATVAANKKSGFGSFEGIDWNIVKPIYANFSRAIVRWPTHLYATAGVKALDSERADRETKLMMGAYGVQPTGQKETPHWFQTVLWKTASYANEWKIITIKDRSRVKLEESPVGDFSRDYLINIAGWKAL